MTCRCVVKQSEVTVRCTCPSTCLVPCYTVSWACTLQFPLQRRVLRLPSSPCIYLLLFASIEAYSTSIGSNFSQTAAGNLSDTDVPEGSALGQRGVLTMASFQQLLSSSSPFSCNYLTDLTFDTAGGCADSYTTTMRCH